MKKQKKKNKDIMITVRVSQAWLDMIAKVRKEIPYHYSGLSQGALIRRSVLDHLQASCSYERKELFDEIQKLYSDGN